AHPLSYTSLHAHTPMNVFVLREKTRPDTLQSSLGRLGRSSNEKTARNFRNICDGWTDRNSKV
ncbi:MAG: hypothetical protein VX367_09615, partial [SAR324 cluster bacterium]|nr:hypothetical protein [SAR324 cluster bacterium]